jgi:hypothetical protein
MLIVKGPVTLRRVLDTYRPSCEVRSWRSTYLVASCGFFSFPPVCFYNPLCLLLCGVTPEGHSWRSLAGRSYAFSIVNWV